MLKLVLMVLGLGALLVSAASFWRYDVTETMAIGDRKLLAVSFAHQDHKQESCTVCHHEFLDQSGPGQCFDCHLRHPQTAHLIQSHFHDLCRGCHQERLASRQDAGPVRRCKNCHQSDDEP